MLHKLSHFSAQYSRINFSLLDQGIISASNFLMGILLARTLGIEGFGQFSMLWIIVLFVISLQSALITFPMMSIGPKLPEADQNYYYGSAFYLQIVFSLLTSLIVAGLAWGMQSILPDWQMAFAAWPLACAAFAFQIQDFIRRYFFARGQPKNALINDALSYVGQLSVLAILWVGNGITTISVLWVIAATSFLAFLVGWYTVKHWPCNWGSWQDAARRHWLFGSWMTIANIIQWSASQGILLLAGILLGTAQVGGVRAVINLAAPVNIVMLGLQNALPVRVSEIYGSEGFEGMGQYLKQVTFVLLGGLSLICILIVAFSGPLMSMLYGAEYESYTPLVAWQAVYILLSGLLFPVSILYRTMEQTRTYALSTTVAAPIALVVTLLALEQAGATAVFWGLVVNQLLCLAIIFCVYNLVTEPRARAEGKIP